MIMLNVCAAACGSLIFCLLALRQRQSSGQRRKYYPGSFVSLSEASQSWQVYRGTRPDRDGYVCNFCGFTIKPSPAELQGGPSGSDIVEDNGKPDSKAAQKRRIKKGKKS